MKLQKLNMAGVAHIIVPLLIIAVVGIGGSYVAVKSQSHADAAIPQLHCTSTYTTSVANAGRPKFTQTFTNLGGGKTGATNGYVDTGALYHAGLGTDVRVGHAVPALVHAQKYTWSAYGRQVYKTGSGAYATFASRYGNGSNCSPASLKVYVN